MNENQKVTFDLTSDAGEVNFANFICRIVAKGLTFEAKVEGNTATVILTGGF